MTELLPRVDRLDRDATRLELQRHLVATPDAGAPRVFPDTALRRALVRVRDERAEQRALAIVREELAACMYLDDRTHALRDIEEGLELLGSRSRAALVVAIERAIDEMALTPVDRFGDYVDQDSDDIDRRWRARLRAVERGS